VRKGFIPPSVRVAAGRSSVLRAVTPFPNRQHRHVGAPYDALGDTTEEEPLDAAAPVGPHDDEVDPLALDVVENTPVGRPGDDESLHPEPGVLTPVAHSLDRRLALCLQRVDDHLRAGVHGGERAGVDDVERVEAGVVGLREVDGVGYRARHRRATVCRNEDILVHPTPYYTGYG